MYSVESPCYDGNHPNKANAYPNSPNAWFIFDDN